MTDDTTDLTPAEERLLRSLEREVAPPAALEDATVRALRRRGRLRAAPRRATPWRALAAMLAVVCLAAGYGLGRWRATSTARPGEPAGAPRFLLLLYDDPAVVRTPAEEQRQYDDYAAWAADLARRGRLVDAEPLDAGGPRLRRVDGTVVVDGAEPDPGLVLGGYFLIRAADAETAVGVARESPHLGYGGTITVRRVGVEAEAAARP